MMIGAIIFDVGQVLVRFDWEGYLESFQFPKETKDVLAKAVFERKFWSEFDRGLFTQQETIERMIQRAPTLELEIRMVFDKVGNAIHCFPDSVSWIRELKSRGLKTYILSNYPEFLYQQTKNELLFEHDMDGAIFSYMVKKVKPEEEIYRILLETYQIKPECAVFLDDCEENLVTARKLGLHTILVQDRDAAKRLLDQKLSSVY